MVKARDADSQKEDSVRRGVTIVVADGVPPPGVVLNLDLKNVPLGEALRMVAELLQMKLQVDRQVVLLVPN
jgi:hypothetical protein